MLTKKCNPLFLIPHKINNYLAMHFPVSWISFTIILNIIFVFLKQHTHGALDIIFITFLAALFYFIIKPTLLIIIQS